MRAALLPAAIAALVAVGACSPKSEEPAAAATPTAFDPKDFSGTWDRYPQALEAGRDPTTLPPRPEAIPEPPLKPEHLAAWKAEQKRLDDANRAGKPIASHYTRCIPDGMPAMMQAMFPMEVLVTPRQITFIQEAYNQVRRVYFNEKLPAVEDAEPGFWGHAVARWEGNDLVTETIGIKDYVRFRNVPHSASMRIHERMRMLDKDHFENEVTVEDPEFLTGPWKWKWVYQRRPDYKMYEYVCEDNREFADPVTGEARLRIDTE
jgi:hypothetical protein